MSAFDSFPLGQPAFVTNVLDRAAHLRGNDEKLFALESHPNSRAYVVHRDSLVVKREADGSRARNHYVVIHSASLLETALAIASANPTGLEIITNWAPCGIVSWLLLDGRQTGTQQKRTCGKLCRLRLRSRRFVASCSDRE